MAGAHGPLAREAAAAELHRFSDRPQNPGRWEISELPLRPVHGTALCVELTSFVRRKKISDGSFQTALLTNGDKDPAAQLRGVSEDPRRRLRAHGQTRELLRSAFFGQLSSASRLPGPAYNPHGSCNLHLTDGEPEAGGLTSSGPQGWLEPAAPRQRKRCRIRTGSFQKRKLYSHS